MADAAKSIRIDIVASGAEAGAKRVNAALQSIATGSKGGAAANDNFANSLKRIASAGNGAHGAGGKVAEVIKDIAGKSAAAVPAVGNLITKLAAFGPMGAIIATVAVAIAAIGVKSLEAASKVEMWTANLLTITGSSQKAKESYAALVDFATKTPFDLGQAVEGFTKLRTLGLQATEKALMSFGNTAAAMGKPLSQMIEAVADAATGEFERLKEFGIKSKVQGDQVKFTFGGVTTAVANNAKAIQKYLEDLGNSKFGGAMARQMDTMKGALSNVQDALFQMFAAIGSGAASTATKNLLKDVASGISAITPLAASLGNVFGAIFGTIYKTLSAVVGAFVSVNTGGRGLQPVLDGLTVGFNLIAHAVELMGNITSGVFSGIAQIGKAVAGALGGVFKPVLDWMGLKFNGVGQDAGLAFIGILRAAKFVSTQIPQVFSIAITAVGDMFKGLGSIVQRLLKGDFSAVGDLGGVISSSLGKAQAGLGKIGDQAFKIMNDTKASAAAVDRLLGKSGVKAKLDAGSMVDPTKDPKVDKKAQAEAERRAKQEKDFWTTLQNEVETAKLLPLAAADLAKQQELQKILGRDLLAGEKARVDSLLQQARTAKFITDATDKHNQAVLEAGQQEELFRKRLAGATEEQLAVEKAVYAFRNSAQRQGVDLQSEAYKLSEAQLRADETRAGIIAKNNDLMKEGLDVAKEYGGTAFANWNTQKTLADKRKALDVVYNGGVNEQGITKAVYNAAVDGLNMASRKSANTFYDEFGQRITDLGEQFSGKFGDAISKLGQLLQGMTKAASGDFSGLGPVGGILNLLGKNADGSNNAIGKAAANASQSAIDKLMNGSALSDPLKSLSEGFGSFKDDFKNLFSKGGDFTKGLGSVLGNVGMGVQMGETADGLMKALGVKSSKMGAQIGGALGTAIFGPIGGIIGSLGGGLLGGALKKTKYATASISSLAGGGLTSGVAGNSSSAQGATSGAAGSVISGLEQIAAQLGGTLTGTPSVSIGTYKGNWRVSTTGRTGKLKGKYGDVVDFGKDGAEEAIAYAIRDALKDGVLTGISEFSKTVLSGGLDTDKALNLATSYESILKDLAAFKNPIKAAVEETVKSIDTLAEQMEKAGASSTDLANVEAWRAMKLDELLKDQVSGFQSLLDELNGDAGGVSTLTQLTNDLSKLDTFKADIASGKTVDQNAFTALADKILNEAGSIYGNNSTDYQAIVTGLKDATTAAMANVKTEFNSAAYGAADTVAAVQAQTDANTANQGVTNDLLAQILTELRSGANAVSSGVGSANGKLTVLA